MRRSISDLEVAYERGFISRIPGYNTILNYLGMKDLTHYLDQLITESSLPLKVVERDFAVDSSGFSTSNFGRYVDLRYGKAEAYSSLANLRLVATTFSMIKEKFGTRLLTKKEVAQVNEVLCKVLCHNICVVIQSMYELGIEPVFWKDEKKAS